MPIKAKYNGSYKDITDLMNVDESIDYVLAKTSSSYKRVYTATRSIEDPPPTTFKSIKPGANLTDYRIYGQTVDGKSVGDRTANLFDINSPNVQKKCYYDATGQKQNSTYHNISDFIPCGANNSYTLSFRVENDFFTNYGIFVNLWDNQKNFVSNLATKSVVWPKDINKTMQYNITPLQDGYITFNYLYDTGHMSNIMLVEGSTALPYEPYGYKVPVTVEGKNLSEVNEFSNSITDTADKLQIWLQQGKDQSFEYPSNSNLIIIAEPTTITTHITITDGNDSIRIKHNGATRDIVIDIVRGLSYGVYSVSFNVLDYDQTTVGGIVINNIMVNKGSIALPYEPYHTPITTPIYLPEQIKKVGDEAEYIDYGTQKQHRVRKNLLNISANTTVVNGISFTVNSDKSITITGNLTQSKADFILIATNSLILNSGEYSVSCENASANTYFIIGGSSSTGHVPYTVIANSNSVKVSCSGGNIGYCRIRVTSNIENPITLYPMIRLASIEDDTYEPYIENVDLDVTLPALPTLPGTNTLSVGTEVQPSKIDITGHIKTISGGS